ncbi:putative U box domain, armadillo-like helical, Zinc finger, RING/FYVE/PHD-type [Dioscorea sansibarensis]
MGSAKHRWKLSFHRSPPAPSSPSLSPATPPPPPLPPQEFLCPISSALMADPVIIPSGQSFERAAIQACKDLSLFPPTLLPSIHSPSSLLLIPNSALQAAILRWCDLSGHPRPLPLSSDSALDLVRCLFDGDRDPSPVAPKNPTIDSSSSRYSPRSSSSLSSYSSSSSCSSSEIAAADDSLRDEILSKLKDPRISEQESALISLRRATRESPDRRISLCTPTLLAALRPLLGSRYRTIQSNAVAALVNLSLEQRNKVPVVRSGAVPALVEVLRCGHDEARDHAAGAIFSLSLEDDNKAAIGVLGAVPLLLHLFARPSEEARARRDTGMAIYHLCTMGTNRKRVAKGARAVVSVAREGGEVGLVAMIVVCRLAGCAEGRAALMDADAVTAIVELLRKSSSVEEEYCVGALYGMSKGGLRFVAVARAAAAAEMVAKVAEKETAGEAVREMARRTVMVIRGEREGSDSVESDAGVLWRKRLNEFISSDSDGFSSNSF